MKFSSALISVVAIGASSVQASISAHETVINVVGITTLSKDLVATASKLTLVNVFEIGPEVVAGFAGIVKQATTDFAAMKGKSSHRHRHARGYTIKEQGAVCNAFIDFVKVHQDLLHVVIGKHGVLEVTGVADETAAVLRGVEAIVDDIAFTLIGEVPHCARKATKEKDALDRTLKSAIGTFSKGLP